MRGDKRFVILVVMMKRITPACAGISFVERHYSAPPMDHPRMRGDKTGRFDRSLNSPGSPPHARG